MTLPIAVLVSGKGTNLQAILDAQLFEHGLADALDQHLWHPHFDHLRGHETLDHLAGHVSDVIARQEHTRRLAPHARNKGSLLFRRNECQENRPCPRAPAIPHFPHRVR